MDDSFNSIVSAVKWGRQVRDNICKFLQFQLTLIITTAVIVAMLGSVDSKQSPIKFIQLFWINLLMDSLASLALSTATPNASVLNANLTDASNLNKCSATLCFILCTR